MQRLSKRRPNLTCNLPSINSLTVFPATKLNISTEKTKLYLQYFTLWSKNPLPASLLGMLEMLVLLEMLVRLVMLVRLDLLALLDMLVMLGRLVRLDRLAIKMQPNCSLIYLSALLSTLSRSTIFLLFLWVLVAQFLVLSLLYSCFILGIALNSPLLYDRWKEAILFNLLNSVAYHRKMGTPRGWS